MMQSSTKKLCVTGCHIPIVLFMTLLSLEGIPKELSQKHESIRKVKVTLDFHTGSFFKITGFIEEKTDFLFVYDRKDVVDLPMIRVQPGKQTVANVLQSIAKVTKLRFIQNNHQIIVKKPVGDVKTLPVSHAPNERKITGTVRDENNEPLPGATVLVKGTTQGTVTNIEGQYELMVPGNSEELIFSYVGYIQQAIEIAGRSVVDVQLYPDISELSEIVVVGYGTQQKKDLTGAIVSIDSKEIEDLNLPSMVHALQGKAPGVQVVQASNAPGGGLSVRIRGGNSILSNNEPLYVIDGLPVTNDNGSPGNGGRSRTVEPNALASLNPNDIESIEVLKDASATAIYGARGANGVVIITTKRGKTGQDQVDFSAMYGVQELISKLDLLNAREFALYANEAARNGGEREPFTDEEMAALGEGTDWQDLIYRTGVIQDYQLSARGGSEALRYTVSGNYYRHEGIIRASDFERYALRLNLDKELGKFKIGNSLQVSRVHSVIAPTDGNSNSRAGVVLSSITAQPVLSPRDENGDYVYETLQGDPFENNPEAIINEIDDDLVADRVFGNLYAEYKLLEGLTFRTSLGADIKSQARDTYYTRQSPPSYGGARNGLAFVSERRSLLLVNTNQLTYQRLFNGMHHLNVTVVQETQSNESRRVTIEDSEFPSDGAGTDAIGGGLREGGSAVDPDRTRWQLASWMGRVFYGFSDRYLLTLSARADGSSRFGENNRWGFFPSAAFAWRLSEERFMADLATISHLKLRASYGLSGNQEIGVLRSRTELVAAGPYSFGNVLVPTVRLNRLGNPDLKWETTAQLNLGADIGLWNERLAFTFDYYRKETTDLLLDIRLPPTSGFSTSTKNIGSVENKGIEIGISTSPVQSSNFSYRITANIAANRSQVLDIGDDEDGRLILEGSLDQDVSFNNNQVIVGEELGVFWGYRTDGIFRDQQEVDAYREVITNSNFEIEEGRRRYVDIDGDGDVDGDDRTILGSPQPDFIYGVSHYFTYRNWELSFFLQGVQGNEILNINRNRIYGGSSTQNITRERWENRWTPGNRDSKYERVGTDVANLNGSYDDTLIEDGSYFRLRNLTVGYNMPVGEGPLKSFRQVRVSASVDNLFTITGYSGYDPDVNSQGQSNVNQGIDSGAYPLARTYTLGVNLGF